MLSFYQIAPWLASVGQALSDLDEDTTGADDFAGAALMYSAEVGAAVASGEDVPPIPDVLKSGVTGKLSPSMKAVLRVTAPVLTFASFQVTGPARKVLKYVAQAISLLIQDKPVPKFA